MSGAEQSRAEQSRAVQSRSRACRLFVNYCTVLHTARPYQHRKRWEVEMGGSQEAHASLGSIFSVAGWVAAAPVCWGPTGTQPLGHEAGRVVTLGELQSMQPGSEGAWGVVAGRGDRCEISRYQNELYRCGTLR